MTEPINYAYRLVDTLAKQARDKLLIPQLMAIAIKKAPLLALPVINPVFGFILGWSIDIFYDEGMLLANFGITNFKVKMQDDDFKEVRNELAEKLKTPLLEKNYEEIKKLSDEFDQKLTALIRFKS